MIAFSRHTLDNGLRVIHHHDPDSPNVVLNLLYDVGSRVEDPEKTGFAHLFEHLMFGGSENIESYDTPLQRVGGQNNAFTSQDITNYYLTLPAANVETGFWLESDRMKALNFDPNVLEVQRKVVMEEFKQRYLNQPYGDFWLRVFPLAFREQGYSWPTIGKSLEHIERFTMEDVREFFYHYYGPNNAILVVAGNIEEDTAIELADKWFGGITSIDTKSYVGQNLINQNEYREEVLNANVPLDAVYLAYHVGSRIDADYHGTDLMSDVLGRGKGSYLYEHLVRDEQVFTSINAYMMGNLEPGLMIIEGKVAADSAAEAARDRLLYHLDAFVKEGVSEDMLEKARNQAASSFEFNQVELLNRAMNLAYFELLGDADMLNQETGRIMGVKPADVNRIAAQVLRRDNCSAILYKKTIPAAEAGVLEAAIDG